MILNIFTDGSYYNDVGGWAAVFVSMNNAKQVVRHICGHTIGTTNNRMEIQPVIESLILLKKAPKTLFDKIFIYSDSQYVVKAINDWHGRKRNKNKDLWEKFQAAREGCHHHIEYKWIRGHSNHQWNDMADQHASEARIHKLSIKSLMASLDN